MLHEGKLYCVLRLGPHYFIMSKCKAVKHVKTYLSPVYVVEFCMVILGAGTSSSLAPLLKVEYPSADLVNAVLCDVSEVVEGYSMKGKWVTSWASSAHNDFLATPGIHEVSGCVNFIKMTCKSCVLLARISFFRLPHMR